MPNSQEQSLDEDVVFMPVTESSPAFLHCEKERHAMETLISAGPAAFYSCLSADHLSCFLSPEEVRHIVAWAQEHHGSQLQVRGEENGEDNGPEREEDLSDTYFPTQSDTPAPCLELGWPEKDFWMGRDCITIHTTPPVEGQPHIREIIRRHLQRASQVIAIVTDKLTDSAVIGDLHYAASHGVPVYIILNQRSFQENFTPNRLKHPNMQVRVLGGKTFCTKTGRTVVGEMKDSFILVDSETVIHGSYSLTWTDAHLHRQLITVMSGPIVELFDQEFRILFAASFPIPDTWQVASVPVDVPPQQQLKKLPDRHLPNHLPLEPMTSSPPAPDSPLDWESLGVVPRDLDLPDRPVNHHEEFVSVERPLQSKMQLTKMTPILDEFAPSKNRFLDKGRVWENATAATNNLQDKSTSFNNIPVSPKESFDQIFTSPKAEIQQRVENKLERAYHRQLSKERDTNSDDRTAMTPVDKRRDQNSRHDMVTFNSSPRRERSRTENSIEEEINMEETRPGVESTPFSRKPLILRVPQLESFSSLSDIIKRLKTKRSSPAQPSTKTAVSEMSRSMIDLSVQNTSSYQDEGGVRVPRLQASCFDPGHVTPALALMRKRNDEIKSLFYRSPKNFVPSARSRSSSLGLQMDWRRSLTDREDSLNELK